MKARIFIIAASCVIAACTNTPTWEAAVIEARQAQRPAPVRHHAQPDASLADAYAVQQRVVSQLIPLSAIAGYKGGLTIKDSWQRFQLHEPVVGVMSTSGVFDKTLSLAGFNKLVVELELAFVFDKPVTAPLSDVSALRQYVRSVHPALELPDLAYEDMRLFTGHDLIANNVSAQRFRLGPALSGRPDDIVTELRCNGEVLSQGRADEVQGGQWQTLLWLVNKLISVGYAIQPGQFVLTGSLGQVVPAQPGACEARFGELSMTFSLRH